jgi:hypothetical protein
MENMETIALIISTSILVIFLVYSIVYNHILHRPYRYHQEVKSKEETELLEDHFKEEEMLEIRENIAAIDALSEAPSIQPEEELVQILIQKDEKAIISEGKKLLKQYNKELNAALPVSEGQRVSDLKDLKIVLSDLEHLVPDQFGDEAKPEMEMGKGMLYDSISRKLDKIIKEQKWNKKLFIQAEKLENLAFEKVKHMEHPDFVETLNVMQQIGNFNSIIEINPQTKLLIFSKDPITFNPAEKVMISLIADNPNITIEKIKKITTWSGNYLNENLSELKDKGILNQKDNLIEIDGLITEEEKRNLQQKLIGVEQKRLDKEKDFEKLRVERESKEIELEKKRVVEKEERLKKEKQDLLKQTRKEAEQKSQEIVSQIDKRRKKKKESIPGSPEEAMDDMESLEAMVNKVEALEAEQNGGSPSKSTSSIEDDIEVEYQEEVKAILQIFDDIREMTGGIIIAQGLLWYLNQGSFPDLKKIELLEIIDLIKEQGKIFNEFTFSGVNLYVYDNIEISKDMEKLLRQFVIYGEMDVEDIQTATDWEEERCNQVLHQLWNQNLMKLKENEKYFIPGLFNTQ